MKIAPLRTLAIGPWPLSPTFHQRRRCPLSSVLYENRTVRYRLTNQANDATPLNWCSSTSHAQFPPKKVVDLIKLRSQGNQAALGSLLQSAYLPCLYACLPMVRQWNAMLGCRIFNGIIKNDTSIFDRKFAMHFFSTLQPKSCSLGLFNLHLFPFIFLFIYISNW